MQAQDFGMFSDAGNAGVEAVVNFARVANLTWSETYKALRKLADSNPDVYGEAMDTMVREIVYDAIGAGTRDEDFYC